MNLPPPKTKLTKGPPKGSGRMASFVRNMKINECHVVTDADLHGIYAAADALGFQVTSCKRNLPGADKLKAGTVRVWRLS